jgi:hypothetical protein
MNKITKQAIAALTAMRPMGPVVTIYSPTHTAVTSPHMSEDQIHLKNLVCKAIEELQQHADGAPAAKRLRETIDELLADQPFWENLTEGLLLCANRNMVQLFYLPMDTEEYVAVSDCFHLAPVLGILHDDQEFYVLGIAQQDPQLYRGDMYGLHPAGIKLPASLATALNIDENNKKGEQQLAASGSSERTDGFNGRGGVRDPREEDRTQFFRMIDHALLDKADRTLPLVLAGVDAEIAEYRAMSKYPAILHGSIRGNIKNTRPDVLFHDAKAIIRDEIIKPKHDQAMQTYKRLRGTDQGRVAQEDTQILSAADQGRVDTLLMGLSRFTRDTIHDNTNPAERITFPQGTMADAFNAIALAVQNTSGSVMMVNQDTLPEGSGMAAILRY